MDRSLKARLIGASVMVLLVVLVVPELLSGRKAATTGAADATASDGQTRTYTIELGRSAAPAATDANLPRPYTPEASPLAAERPARAKATPPAREATTAVSPASSPGAREAAAPSEPKPAAALPARTAADVVGVAGSASAPRDVKTSTSTSGVQPSRGTWSVQVGAFASAESARKLVAQLDADGFDAYVSAVERNGRSLHRVRVGRETARSAADALAVRLKARGLPVSLVAND